MIELPFLNFLTAYVEKPSILALMVPVIMLLLVIVLLRLGKGEKTTAQQRMRIFVFISRLLIFFLLLLALASPYALYEKLSRGEPAAVFLLDNSSSYDLFDRARGYRLYDQIKQYADVDLRLFGDHQRSPLGNDVMASLRKGRSVVLMSDGQLTEGSNFGDVALQAQKLNASINVIQQEPLEKDYSVLIDGPSRISSGVETEYTVKIVGMPLAEHDVTVLIDGQEFLRKRVHEEVTFVKTFTDGYHAIQAELQSENDHFSENNVFYKSVKVIEKPRVAFMNDGPSALPQLLKNVYVLEEIQPPGPLSNHYALLMNDIPADDMANEIVFLRKFVSDGNGLVVFGGLHSFERGGYQGSAIEDILPVTIAGAEKQEGSSSVVILVDISQSFALDPFAGPQEGGRRYTEGDIGVSKALAINILEGIRQEDYLGVIAFDTAAYVVSDIEMILRQNLGIVKSKVASLVPALAGETMPTAGIIDAVQMLNKGPGAKNIILISDGQIQKRDQFLAAANYAANHKVKIYTIGVGELTNEQAMRDVATITGGEYFSATQKNKIKIMFGEGEEGQTSDGYSVILREKNHYITEHLSVDGRVYGFNEAVPKPSAQLLATTHQGDALLVVWRYGLGRVVTVLTDDGDLFAADLLSKKNSKLLLRAMSWAVGDPERKNPSSLTVNDARIGEKVEITYRGKNPPQGSISFSKTEEDTYVGYADTTTAGFHNLLGARYAVTYAKEYESLGFNEEVLQLAQQTGGKVFSGNSAEEIAQTIQAQSQDTVLERWQYQWPFVMVALILFLIEVCIRRVVYFRT